MLEVSTAKLQVPGVTSRVCGLGLGWLSAEDVLCKPQVSDRDPQGKEA